MKRFFKFSVSIFCISLLSACPPWASLDEAQNNNSDEVIEDAAPEYVYDEALLI
jgi:hypothetical protein